MDSLETIVLQLTENKKIYPELQVLWSSGSTKEQVDWSCPCTQCSNRIHSCFCTSKGETLQFSGNSMAFVFLGGVRDLISLGSVSDCFYFSRLVSPAFIDQLPNELYGTCIAC